MSGASILARLIVAGGLFFVCMSHFDMAFAALLAGYIIGCISDFVGALAGEAV